MTKDVENDAFYSYASQKHVTTCAICTPYRVDSTTLMFLEALNHLAINCTFTGSPEVMSSLA